MRRTKFIIPTVIFGGIVFLVWSGGIQFQSGYTSPPAPTSTCAYQELTGKLLISPYGSQDDVLTTLKKAKYTIDIRGYQISDEKIINTLRHKADTGVKVRIVFEKYTHGNKQEDFLSLFKALDGSTVQLHDDTDLGITYQHAKTFLIDGSIFIISTANSTYPGFFSNREYRFIGENTCYTDLLTTLFNLDREKKHQQPTLPKNLRICPFNCRTSLHVFIESASKSIIIQAQYLEDPALIEQLQKKLAAGVTVAIIVGKYQTDVIPASLHNVTRQQANPNIHAKTILIDKQQLYIGSMNLSTNAIDNNREIGIVTTDTFVLKKFGEQFEEDRQKNSIPFPWKTKN